MDSNGLTLVLLILIVVAVMATKGKLGEVVKAAFG